ncbi:MAG TPA: FAD-dependent oxidoreductase [Thermotogota bacterium]|nr:FAD-dependent oxidoreductase [Thermotogota bacterium]NLZ14081.1 FAD-dependent oxidoreductase [Thermotogaceae bacterium]HNR63352.1 FAD-dependent oxidoreductase [Thermotogota bacterium]HNT95275.1 FAD-dependent oxidoreductase [Thermotogota bacterium]HOZ11591.1 FAD-dependent oxidoreductase [Thermotogota bacterium]
MRIAVIGSGTSAIGFLYHLLKTHPEYEVDIFEKGMEPAKRTAKGESILYGFGGAGTFSDGKLSLSPQIGGEVAEYIGIESFQKHLSECLELWTLGFDRNALEKSDLKAQSRVREIKRLFSENQMDLTLSDFIHVGTDNLAIVIKQIYALLSSHAAYHFHFSTPIKDYSDENATVIDEKGRSYGPYDQVILAVGRSGSLLLKRILELSGADFTSNTVDLGVRYEMPAILTDEITDILYEFKVSYITAQDDKVRTFCVNPRGYVVREDGADFSLVNGHSFSHQKSELTNFAILVTHKFTDPFKDSFEYASSLARLANKLAGSGKILVQRYKDFKALRRSTISKMQKSFVVPSLKEATPGDLNLILPRRTAADIEEFVERLSRVLPGTNNPDNLLYGIEAKFYSTKPDFDRWFQIKDTPIRIIGDASGYTRGIVQATISGIALAENLG